MTAPEVPPLPPALVAALTVQPPFAPGGQTAWVAPVRDSAGAERVMKVAWRHPEAEHEADGLHAWAGYGAVRMYAVERTADTIALLLEWCRPGIPLSVRPEPEQDEVVARLLRRLWITPPAGHPFRSLRAMCAQWADEFAEQAAAASGSRRSTGASHPHPQNPRLSVVFPRGRPPSGHSPGR